MNIFYQINQGDKTGANLSGVGRLSVLALLFCFISSLAAAAIPPWEIDALLNKDAPSFQLTDLTGKDISSKDFRGKVVLLNFWATWCPPCREEMPALTELYSRFKDKGLLVLGLSVDSKDKVVKDFLAKNPVAFPIAVDSSGKIADRYKVYTYPTTFLLDQHGVVREFFLGGRQWNEPSFIEKIKALLSNGGTAHKGTTK